MKLRSQIADFLTATLTVDAACSNNSVWHRTAVSCHPPAVTKQCTAYETETRSAESQPMQLDITRNLT
jgi:hypothetical protein